MSDPTGGEDRSDDGRQTDGRDPGPAQTPRDDGDDAPGRPRGSRREPPEVDPRDRRRHAGDDGDGPPGVDDGTPPAVDGDGPPPGGGPGRPPHGDGDWTLPEEDDEEMHPMVDAAGSASVYLIAGSVALVFVGLAALVLGYDVVGRAAVTVAIVGATGSMLLATVVGALSGAINPLD